MDYCSTNNQRTPAVCDLWRTSCSFISFKLSILPKNNENNPKYGEHDKLPNKFGLDDIRTIWNKRGKTVPLSAYLFSNIPNLDGSR